MELRHLRYFIAAAETEHFGQAARRLNVTQPALSQQIADLEREMDTPLFTRVGRGVQLTPAGRSLLASVQPLLLQLHAAIREARKIGRSVDGKLTLGLPEGAAGTRRIMALVVRTKSLHPALDIKTSGIGWLEQADAILDGRLDAGFVWSAGQSSDGVAQPPVPGLQRLRVMEDRAQYALLGAGRDGEHDPFRVDGPVPMASLASRPFLLFERERHPSLHDAIVRAVQRAGGPLPTPAEGVGTAAGATALLTVSEGWTLITNSVRLDLATTFRAVQILDFHFDCGLDLVWRDGDDRPSIAALVREARALLAQADDPP